MKAKCLFFDPSLINFINDDGNGVITGNVAGRAEGILSDVKGNHEGADRAVGSPSCYQRSSKERQAVMMEPQEHPEKQPWQCEGHDERNNRARWIGIWFMRQTAWHRL